MNLEREYERSYQRNELLSLQTINIKYVRYNIKSRYPEKIINSIFENHRKMFVPYSAECEYQLDFRVNYKPVGVAFIYHPTQVKNLNKIKEFEKDGYIFYKIDNLLIFTYNSIKKFNPLYKKNHIPKPMLMTKMLQLIDRNPDNFKDWGCKITLLL